jgi:hypothetical protein
MLGLADFLRAWYPHVMVPYERRTSSVDMPGPWAFELAGNTAETAHLVRRRAQLG